MPLELFAYHVGAVAAGYMLGRMGMDLLDRLATVIARVIAARIYNR